MPYANKADREACIERLRRKRGYIECECGCGEKIPALRRDLKPARFAPGHRVVYPWKKPGDTLRHSHGYILEYAPDHPRAHNGYVYQHVLAWERAHGKPVPDGHQVHHLDGVKDNNDPANLELLTAAEHSRQHMIAAGVDELRRRQSLAAAARRGKPAKR